MKVAVIACKIMKNEIEKIVKDDSSVEIVEFLDFGLHVYSEELLNTLIQKINSLKGKVDAVFLGYGYCQVLSGIENKVELPVILPQANDCLAILLTPRGYARQKVKEAGTWFMSSGWCERGLEDTVIKELRLDTVRDRGLDPLDIAKMLFQNYTRVLYVDTSVGDRKTNEEKAKEFARTFNLKYEAVEGTLSFLSEEYNKVKTIWTQKRDLKPQ